MKKPEVALEQTDMASPSAGLAARAAVALLPPLLLASLGYWILHLQGYSMVDDSFITFRYVINFANGDGLVWNPGERVEGYTNLLWVLLLTPFALLKIDLILPAAALGVLFSGGTLELLRRMTRRALPLAPARVLVLPGLILACNPSFVYWAIGGMETPLFCFLVLLSAHLLLRARGRQPHRLPWTVGLPLALCCLTRPEGALISGLFLAMEAAASVRGSRPWLQLRRRLMRVLAPAVLVAAVLLAHLVFRLAYYGDPLPNTFYAKVIFGWVTVVRGASHIHLFLLAGGLVALPGVLAFALRKNRKSLRPYLAYAYILFGVYLLYLLLIGGDLPEWFRFYVPLLPLPMLALAALIGSLDARIKRRVGRWAGRAFVAAACAVLLTTNLSFWPSAEPALIPAVKGIKQIGVTLYRIFFARHVPPDAYIAAQAVGFLGYHARNRILDTWGLNDRYIARQNISANPHKKFAHDKSDWTYVLGRLPDFIFLLGKYDPLKGYDICWPSHLPLGYTIYRRNTPLSESQRSLGMPPGVKRTLLLPPPCLAGSKPEIPPQIAPSY